MRRPVSQLLALSFDVAASPSITIRSARQELEDRAGWGFGWYPEDDNAAIVIKDPLAARDTTLTESLSDWERFRSTLFLCHIRGAAKRSTQQDTHPFLRSYAGRNYILAHSGELSGDFRTHLPLGAQPVYEPLGHTDSEHAMCWLLTRMREMGARSLADLGWERLLELLRTIDRLGTANVLLTDGHDLIVYRDESAFSELHWQRRHSGEAARPISNDFVEFGLSGPLDENRSVVLVSTTPLGQDPWNPIAPGELLVVRLGDLIWSSVPDGPVAAGLASARDARNPVRPGAAAVAALPSGSAALTASALPTAGDSRRGGPVEGPSRRFSVVHETIYSYATPVEFSKHSLHLQPVHDLAQALLDWKLDVEPPGSQRRFEDVFGNQGVLLEHLGSFSKLRITSRARVEVRESRHFEWGVGRTTIPLVWMPWQRQMMTPYLLPPELPETQLLALSEYAMSFVERQNYDLVEVLLDMNRTIHHDYRYIPGSTVLETTPFEVYTQRRGVCQDFANLFICLARLLSVPARYRVGYIHLEPGTDGSQQCGASHAWAEVYLPRTGWIGFDPTNGTIADLSHVRVAVGRNYSDATPTSGTLFRGGQGETLTVKVQVEMI